MGLEIGKVSADSGMTKAIYDELSPPLKAAAEARGAPAEAQAALDAAREGWKRIAFAVATGVITHIRSNVEVAGVETRGDVAASVSGATGPAPPGPHSHLLTLSATQGQVTFRQSNDGKGHVQ